MRVKLEDLSPEKRTAVQDFKTDITTVFNDLYEDKWDQERWDEAVGKQISRPPCSLSGQTAFWVDVKYVDRTRVQPEPASRSRSCALPSIPRWAIYLALWSC